MESDVFAAWCLLDSFPEVEGILCDVRWSIRGEEEGQVAEFSKWDLVGLGLGEGVLLSLLDGCNQLFGIGKTRAH